MTAQCLSEFLSALKIMEYKVVTQDGNDVDGIIVDDALKRLVLYLNQAGGDEDQGGGDDDA